MTEPNRDKQESLFKAWSDAAQARDAARMVLTKAESVLAKAVQDLGKALSPPDAKPEEEFNVWIAGALIVVTNPSAPPYAQSDEPRPGEGPYKIHIRCQTK